MATQSAKRMRLVDANPGKFLLKVMFTDANKILINYSRQSVRRAR